jgi:hypothetical protein
MTIETRTWDFAGSGNAAYMRLKLALACPATGRFRALTGRQQGNQQV